MPILDWFRPPRHLLTLYLAGTFAAAGALAWLGWRLIDQERALDAKHAQDRLDIVVDRVAAALQLSMNELERNLSAAGGTLPGDTLVLTADRSSMQGRPSDRLVFFPVVVQAGEPPADIFRAGETAEISGGDPARAIAIYRELARPGAAPVRAGALVRLGRSLRRMGQYEEALRAYAGLALLGATPIEGLPAELAAREARCTVLETMGRRADLEREARELYCDLAGGRWQLRHADWDFRMEEARTWAGSALVPFPGLDAKIALSAAAESLWKRWPELPSSGRSVTMYGNRPVLQVWAATPERLTAVLAGSGYLEAACRQAGGEAQVQICLTDRDGQVILGRVSGPQATRGAATTRLPWNLSVSAANPAVEIAEAGTRRHMLLAGLALSGNFTSSVLPEQV